MPCRRGAALILVLITIAFATVMGLALLSSASLQANITSNAVQADQARYLADSGLNLGVYYLLHPDKSPKAPSDRYWTGGTGISLGASVSGTVDVTATPGDPANPYPPQFTLRTTASALTPSGRTTIHTGSAVVNIGYVFDMPAAAAFNTNITCPAGVRFNGDVISNGSIQLQSGDLITGNVTAAMFSGGTVNGTLSLVPAGSLEVPSSTNISFSAYTPTYRYNGTTYNAALLSGGTWSARTLSADPVTNPGGIFYTTSDVVLSGNCTINGTLIVRGGRLRYANGNSSITPVSGFPALMVDKDIQVIGASAVLTVNGLVWTKQGISQMSSPNTGSMLTINGALILDAAATWYTSYTGIQVVVNYTPANLNVPDFSSVCLVPKTAHALSWSIDQRSDP